MVWKTKQMKNKLNFLGTKQVKKKLVAIKQKWNFLWKKIKKFSQFFLKKNQRWNFLNFWNFLIFLIFNFV